MKRNLGLSYYIVINYSSRDHQNQSELQNSLPFRSYDRFKFFEINNKKLKGILSHRALISLKCQQMILSHRVLHDENPNKISKMIRIVKNDWI
jgi:hypothetical protein